MITIDGSAGGGQMLRTALGLSALTGKPLDITNIRCSRPNPGLAAQHLCAIRAVSMLCDAEVEGATKGSLHVRFSPGAIKGGKYDIDIGTAGAITLVLQAALLPAAFAPKPVIFRISGGTDVSWSPPIDYFRNVFAPALRPFCDIATTVSHRGYYPAGGGSVEVKITPGLARTSAPDWDGFAPIIAARVPQLERTSRGALIGIKGVAHASAVLAPKRPAERMAETVRFALAPLDVPLDIAIEYPATRSPGGGITLWAIFSDSGEMQHATQMGSDGLLNADPSGVGSAAAHGLLRHIKGDCALDEFLADQLVPWLALAGKGALRASATDHVRTNIAVVEQFLGKRFDMQENSIRRV